MHWYKISRKEREILLKSDTRIAHSIHVRYTIFGVMTMYMWCNCPKWFLPKKPLCCSYFCNTRFILILSVSWDNLEIVLVFCGNKIEEPWSITQPKRAGQLRSVCRNDNTNLTSTQSLHGKGSTCTTYCKHLAALYTSLSRALSYNYMFLYKI